MQTTTVNPRRIEPLHSVENIDLYEALVESMAADGWTGAPIVIVDRAGSDPLAVTGSHRIEAARDTGIDVPTIQLADLLDAHGDDLDALVADAKAAGMDDDEAIRDAIVRASYTLPADVADEYGLDAH